MTQETIKCTVPNCSEDAQLNQRDLDLIEIYKGIGMKYPAMCKTHHDLAEYRAKHGHHSKDPKHKDVLR